MLAVALLSTVATLRSHSVDVWPWNNENDEVAGVFIFGFEFSEFLVCQPDDLAGRRYALHAEADIQLMAELASIGVVEPPRPPGGLASAFLSFEGRLEAGSAEGYGHMGQYEAQVVITELESIRPGASC